MASSCIPPSNLIDCAICLGEQRVPRTLPCLHSFCEACLQTHISISTNSTNDRSLFGESSADRFIHSALYETGQYFPCPTCREVTALPSNGVVGFRKDFRIVEFTEAWKSARDCITHKVILCDVCTKYILPEKGGSFCVDCQKNFCDSCCSHHNEKAILNSHIMIQVSRNHAMSSSKCEIHDNETTKYFCENCNEQICVLCILGNTHRDHVITSTMKTLISKRSELKECMDHLSNQIWTLQDIIFNLTCMEGKIKGRYEENKLQMKKNSRKFLMFKDDVKRICELDKAYAEQTKDVFERKEQCREYLRQFKNLETRLHGILQIEDIDKVLKNYTDIIKEVKQIDMSQDFKRQILRLSNRFKDFEPSKSKSSDYGEFYYNKSITEKPRDRGTRCSTIPESPHSAPVRHARSSSTSRSSDRSSACVSLPTPRNRNLHPVYDARKYVSSTSVGTRQPTSIPCVKLMFTVGGCGRGMGQLNLPYSLAFGQNDQLVVAENGNCRLQIFDHTGHSEKIISLDLVPRCAAVMTNGDFAVTDDISKTVKVISQSGEIKGTFMCNTKSFPFRVSSLPGGKLIVSDSVFKCLHIISPDGESKQIGCLGNTRGKFYNPSFFTSDYEGNILVTDLGHHNVKVFDKNGCFMYHFGCYGNGRGQLKYPKGIACDLKGNIFVADSGNDRIVMFSKLGVYLKTLVDKNSGINKPMGLAYSSHQGGRLAISMPDQNEVTVYQLTPSIHKHTRSVD